MPSIKRVSPLQRVQIADFFESIYAFNYRGGGVILDDGAFKSKCILHSVNNLIKHACRRIARKQVAYASLNIYHQRSGGYYQRTDDYLWRFNHIVIDIDYKGIQTHNIEYIEEKLQESILWQCNSFGIPIPNHIVFTGSGGCHLYYLFEDLPNGRDKKMNAGIQATKMKITSMWVDAEKQLGPPGVKFEVDIRATDASRMLRIPGSIHETTGRMCHMVSTGIVSYKYHYLCSLLSEKKWNGKYVIENAIRDIEKSRSGRRKKGKLFKTYSGRNMTRHCLGVKRINELLGLAQSNWGFMHCREVAAHLLWVWGRDAHMNDNEITEKLHELNRMFHTPLSERELLYTARGNGKSYKYSNTRIRVVLGLDGTEGYFTGCRSRKGKGRAMTTKLHKRLIAILVLAGKSIAEIARSTSLSISIIKRRRAEMNQKEGFGFWASIAI